MVLKFNVLDELKAFTIVKMKIAPFAKHSSFHYGHLLCLFGQFAHKVYEILQTLIVGWLAQSLKCFEKLILRRLNF